MLIVQTINGDAALNLGDRVIVASKSQPGTWYEIKDGACECKGFAYRRTCRHLAVADALVGGPLCGICGLAVELGPDGVCGPCAGAFEGAA